MALKNELRTQGDFLFKHRSYLPVIIIIIGLYVYIQQQYAFTQLGATNQLNYELLCLVISLFGLFIRIVTIGYSGKNTSGRNTKAGQIADSVNTTGMYSLCRHPLYVGNFFMWLGIAILTQNFWFIIAFVLFYWLYYERIMYAEETFLIANYGEAYTNWSKKLLHLFLTFLNGNRRFTHLAGKKLFDRRSQVF